MMYVQCTACEGTGKQGIFMCSRCAGAKVEPYKPGDDIHEYDPAPGMRAPTPKDPWPDDANVDRGPNAHLSRRTGCTRCHDIGWVSNGLGHIICPECKGNRSYRSRTGPYTYQKCPACKGEGRRVVEMGEFDDPLVFECDACDAGLVAV
jgi:DnaJ-class molecular chaperone